MTAKILKFDPARVRHKRRKLAGEVQAIAADIAKANFKTQPRRQETPMGSQYAGQIIIGIGKNRGMWCDPNPDGCGLFNGAYWATGESLCTPCGYLNWPRPGRTCGHGGHSTGNHYSR